MQITYTTKQYKKVFQLISRVINSFKKRFTICFLSKSKYDPKTWHNQKIATSLLGLKIVLW